MLTGPTGWIGQALLALMHRDDDVDSLAATDRISLFGSRDGEVVIAGHKAVPVRPLGEIRPDDVDGAHVIHLAYLTKDKVAQLGEDAFWKMNRQIDGTLLTALRDASPATLFVASSGAAQLAERRNDRHPYGLSKLEQETRFLEWARQSGVPTMCGRIFNLAGPHINKLDAYAVSNFAQQALRERRIAISAALPVFRSFLHVEDLGRIVLRAARSGIGRNRPWDLCGTQLLEMQDIAEMVAAEVGVGTEIERPVLNLETRSDYLGAGQDTWEISAELSVRLTDARTQVRDTVDWIRKMESTAFQQASF